MIVIRCKRMILNVLQVDILKPVDKLLFMFLYQALRAQE
jgi:hypothetical protein